MKFPIKPLATALCALLLNGLLPSAAPAQDMPARGPMPFAAFDRDGNGQVSEEEFTSARRERMEARMEQRRARCDAASERMFERFDANGDGQLSADELAAGRQARMQSHRGMGMGYGPGMGEGPGMGYGPGMGDGPGMGYGPGMGRGMGMMRNRPSYSSFDLDADGVVTEEEFYTARNNRIRERMEQGYRMRHLPDAPTFAELDSDGDGKLSAEEFAAHRRTEPWGGRP